jgi:hypothetical protein
MGPEQTKISVRLSIRIHPRDVLLPPNPNPPTVHPENESIVIPFPCNLY